MTADSSLPLPTAPDLSQETESEAPRAGISDRAATQQAREQQVGQRPGTLTIREGSLPPRLFLISYSDSFFTEAEYRNYDDLWAYFQANPQLKHWLDVRGYNDLALMQRLMQDFGIHALHMEDVLGDYQRAKVDVFDESRLFLVSRMTDFTSSLEIDDDQLSLVTGSNFVVSFQDDYDDCLDSVRNRLRSGFSMIRRKSSLYLAYALTDVVLDHYYPTMAAIGDYIEVLEDRIFNGRPNRRLLSRILQIKKDIVRFRRLVYPEREKIAEILRMPEQVIPEDIKVYFKDCYDHAIQAMDLAESYRESISSLMDLYLSDQSNRMNEVMKVLTIISSIFIPLSFVVGLYGMNFQRENPDGTINHLNMPELYTPWGYPALLGLLAVIVAGQLIYFYRKGWLTNR
ncbi:magnesium/cobalt transporter CorA [Hymenobacter cellulosivorans]|uniref:Magnesium transport protein CorA n=1 Tax=Hymenobacter cellulosivorans TaxID=2932249 RepID=A0ABY4F3U8_9BACT|nr:magnesium/cobalt transporter CorA [Hymenobacter cellulosivorans]UOQ51325.1 magnesium/cobalt transporter CorA [Hymenobacter cellulosivorans]